MKSRGLALVVFVVACRETGATADAAIAAPSASAPSADSAPSASPSAPSATTATTARVHTTSTTTLDAGPVRDFEDQFAFGGFDAGAGDASRLATRPGYEPYANGRYSFGLDVPRAFDAMPDPENGDGRQWRIDHVAAMTASGMHVIEGVVGLSCASSPHVTAHTESKSSCWATGKRSGWIFWERQVIAHDVVYSLRFQYVESMKSAMDPVVTHVNKSWSF